MAEQPPRFSIAGAVPPSIILVAVAVYGYLTYTTPLRTVRPRIDGGSTWSPPEFDQLHSEYARLWQDPLGDEYWNHFKNHGEENKEVNVRPFDFSLGKLPRLIIPVLVPGGPGTNDRELRRRTRYAVIAALMTRQYRPVFADRLHYFPFDFKSEPTA